MWACARLTPADHAQAILDALRADTGKTIYTGQNWNRRFREYSDRLKSPDLAVVAGVLRELLLIGRGKELSFGERRLQEQAMSLVTGELAPGAGSPRRTPSATSCWRPTRRPRCLRRLRTDLSARTGIFFRIARIFFLPYG